MWFLCFELGAWVGVGGWGCGWVWVGGLGRHLPSISGPLRLGNDSLALSLSSLFSLLSLSEISNSVQHSVVTQINRETLHLGVCGLDYNNKSNQNVKHF